jgi:hypothetical protein
MWGDSSITLLAMCVMLFHRTGKSIGSMSKNARGLTFWAWIYGVFKWLWYEQGRQVHAQARWVTRTLSYFARMYYGFPQAQGARYVLNLFSWFTVMFFSSFFVSSFCCSHSILQLLFVYDTLFFLYNQKIKSLKKVQLLWFTQVAFISPLHRRRGWTNVSASMVWEWDPF